eukprot:14775383-Alexandrium_andersonii.AAC.1
MSQASSGLRVCGLRIAGLHNCRIPAMCDSCGARSPTALESLRHRGDVVDWADRSVTESDELLPSRKGKRIRRRRRQTEV